MADSSTEVSSAPADTVVIDADSAPAPVVNQAEPTPAKEPSSVLDAVSKALSPAPKTGVDAGAPTAENRSSKDDPTPKPQATESDELSDEEKKTLSDKSQQRFRELVSKKNEALTERDTFKDKAENFDRLTGYLTRHGISSDEANNSLEITRLIKIGDYQGAIKIMQPIYSELQKRAGEVLDTDLQEEVRLGTTPHDRALEVQRARASEAARRQQDSAAAERRSTEEKQQANTKFVGEIAKAADDWAKGKAGADPDWDKKANEVAELVELDLRKNGFPKSSKEALDRSEAALDKVNKRWASLRPAPVEIKPNLSGGARSSTRADAKPKSALDAVEQSLAG